MPEVAVGRSRPDERVTADRVKRGQELEGEKGEKKSETSFTLV